MLSHPTMQRNLNTLKNDSCIVANTVEGQLACGDIGQGLLMKPREALSFIMTSTNL
jgi:phosphopantothenoylcysteine decarboxylase/phosphopantothenate--cysteine ligase